MPDNTERDPHPEWLQGRNPEAIEQQERDGQQQVIRDGQLPTKLLGCTADDLADAGILLGRLVDGDPLFRHAQLPDGWAIRATDHLLWCEIIDEQGLPWFEIFYKAAFYDRRALLRPVLPDDPNSP